MRLVQRIFHHFISISIVAAGAIVAAFPFNAQVAQLVHRISGDWMLCLLLGIAAGALGIFALLPFELFQRKGRSISFTGPTGAVSIHLESFEMSLRKTIAKLPMVKRVSVNVTPRDNDRKVGIEAVVSLKKPAETSTRETAERLREFIDKVSRQILGADEIMSVDLQIQDVLVDTSQTAESLNSILTAAEKNVAPVAVGAAVPTMAAAAQAIETEDRGEEPHRPLDEGPQEPEAHSADLLTYEEAEQLHQPQASAFDAPDVTDLQDAEASESTSFDSLGDSGQADANTEGKPQ